MKDLNVQRILEIMQEESSIFGEILFLSKKKTDALVKRQIEELDTITNIEIELSQKIEALETERGEKVKNLEVFLGSKEKITDISMLAKLLDRDTSMNLLSLRDEINKLILELKNLNDLNGKLLKNSLEYVDFFMNLVTNVDDSSDNNYSNQGKLSEGNAPRRMFDLKL